MYKMVVLLGLVVGCCLADYPAAKPPQAPYPPSGTKPDGPQLLLPGEQPPNEYGPPQQPPTNEYGPPQQPPQQPPTNEYGPPASEPAPEATTTPPRGDGVDAANSRLMERLRQTPGSERAVYHVYLPDGRLQRVRYTAAPLSQLQSGSQREGESYYVKVPEGRLDAYRSSQAQQADQQPQADGYLPPKKSEELKIASVHFMDVEPVPGPIYNIDKNQLSRILRRTH